MRLVAPQAENHWDNSLAYLVASGLALYYPVRWLLQSDSLFLMVLAPLLGWVVQVIALRIIYQVGTLRAWALGLTHTVLGSFVTTATAFTAGVIAAYIMYGKIIADPVRAVKIILRLIGIELPLDG